MRNVRLIMMAAPLVRSQSNTLLLLTKAMAKFVDVSPAGLAAAACSRVYRARPVVHILRRGYLTCTSFGFSHMLCTAWYPSQLGLAPHTPNRT